MHISQQLDVDGFIFRGDERPSAAAFLRGVAGEIVGRFESSSKCASSFLTLDEFSGFKNAWVRRRDAASSLFSEDPLIGLRELFLGMNKVAKKGVA